MMNQQDYFSFVHVTDIHLRSNPNHITNRRFHTFVHDFLPELQPRCVVATGDLSTSISFQGHSLPNEDEWKFYKSTLEESHYFDPEKWLDIRGNHDAWDSTDSEKKYYLNYSVYGYYNRGLIYEQVYQYKDQRIRFIAIDASYAPFKSFSGILNQPELDSLEKMLQRNNEFLCTILLCHFPLFTMDNRTRTTTGLTLYDLIHIYRPTLMLNGHIHSVLGKNASIIHSCNTVEIQSPQFKRVGLFRVFTIHNNHIYWSTYSIKQFHKKPFVFVCNPQNCITIDTPISHEFDRLPSELFVYVLYFKEIQSIQFKHNKKVIEPSSSHSVSPQYTIYTFKQQKDQSTTIPYYLRFTLRYEKPTPSFLSSLLTTEQKEEDKQLLKDDTESESEITEDEDEGSINKSGKKKFRKYKSKHEDNTINIYSSPLTLYKIFMYFYTLFARFFMHINLSIVINKLPYILAAFFGLFYTFSHFYAKSVLNYFQSIRYVDGTPTIYIRDIYHNYNYLINYCNAVASKYLPDSIVQFIHSLSDHIPSYLPSLRTRYQQYFDIYYSFPFLPNMLRYIASKWLLVASDVYIYIAFMVGILTFLVFPQNTIHANGEKYWTTLWGFVNRKTGKRYSCLDHPTLSTMWFVLQNVVVILYLFLFYAIPIPHYMTQYYHIIIRSILKGVFFLFMMLMSRSGKPIRSLVESPEFFFSFTDDVRPTLFFIIMIREIIMA